MAATHYVHPLHGICRVVGNQDRKIDGKIRTYVELRVDASPSGRAALSMLLPEDQLLDHVRTTSSPDEAKGALAALGDSIPSKVAKASSWRSRVAKTEKCADSGDLVEMARVYRDLEYRDRERGISSTERRAADRVHDLIVGELVGALDWTVEQAVEAVAEQLEDEAVPAAA